MLVAPGGGRIQIRLPEKYVSYSLTIDQQRDLVLVRFEGEFRIKEVGEYRALLEQDPRFHEGMVRLLDLRNVTVAPPTPGVMQASDMWRTRKLASKLAFVVDSDLMYGTIRMFQQLAHDEQTVAVFRDYAEALAWLEVTPDPEPE